LAIPESHNPIALRLDEPLPRNVRRIPMQATIDFHDQALLAAYQTSNKRADGNLAAELETVELARPQCLPEFALSRGGVVAHGSGALLLLGRN
jgi:hypothetical protein